MIVASIQARMGSSRLPGKVLADICGKPMLLLQIERINKSRLIDKVIVGTSNSSRDDEIFYFCKKNNVECYRGSEEDVLDRISSLLLHFNVEIHVECYGDSPLIDPQIIDEFIGYYLKHKKSVDYVSSALKTTYPPGLEVTVYGAQVLLKANQLVDKNDPMREHVGYNVTRFPEIFKIKSLEAPPWFFVPNIYLEVDTQKDLELLRSVVQVFYKKGQDYFSLRDILKVLRDKPSLHNINKDVERRWKKFRNEDV